MQESIHPLRGQVAVVTGGAGGLGSIICHTLAMAGASVVIGYNSSAEAAQRLAETMPKAQQPHLALPAPVTDSTALAELARLIRLKLGRCDILINNAGTTRYVEHADLDSLDDALIDHILTTNVRGSIAMVRALRPLLEESGNGLVVNISSIAAKTAMGSNIAYCASKAALDNLTQSLARALAPQIRVNSVAPGLADTEFVAGLDNSWRNDQAARTPLGRLAQPQEVADAVLALATALRFTTGAIIPVDGGRPLS
ncbi:SDR family oxidoreductase [Pseudomonas luteola]|uniref:SDR family NAD(P)-dependent oxidoreductase n=1 Tax=Pseudomonas luteola TaxID=47886 RepID=UPI000F7A5805|nr:SDR family oxidoreductase [Pseudomonas luteola]RRW39894.1 SDR family oxidoreductase [Pseudomonas luteola]